MKTELLGQEKNLVTIKLDYEAAEFDKAFKKTLRKLAQDINIKGFRKGHAPRSIIESRVGKEYILNEAVENLVNDSIPEIVNEYELELLASPVLKQSNAKEGEPLTCELTFEVMPEVKLPEFADITVERVKTNVTDDMVNELVLRIRRDSAKTYKVGTGEGEQDRGVVEDQDIVKVDFSAHVEGEENDFPSQVRTMDLADLTIRPEVRATLAGHKVGEMLSTDFRAEDNYPQKELAGKMIHYDMKIMEITGRTLPELNEEFFKEYLGEDTDILTEDAFRSWCREHLEADVTEQYDGDAAARAMAEIVRRTELEVPETMLKREIAAMRKRDEDEARERYNTDLKGYLGSDDDPDWEKNYLDILKIRAEASIRQMLVLDTIAKENEVKVEKEDLAHWAQVFAVNYGVEPDVILSQLARNRDFVRHAVGEARDDKVLKLVLSKVNVQDVDQLSAPAPVSTEAPALAEGENANPEASEAPAQPENNE